MTSFQVLYPKGVVTTRAHSKALSVPNEKLPRAKPIPMAKRHGNSLYLLQEVNDVKIGPNGQQQVVTRDSSSVVKIEHPTFLQGWYNSLIAPGRYPTIKPRAVHSQSYLNQSLSFHPGKDFVYPGFIADLKRTVSNPTMIHSGDNIQLSVFGLYPDECLPLEVHHDSSQAVYIASGVCKFQTHLDTQILVPGNAVVVPQGMPHAFVNDAKDQVTHAFSVYCPKAHPDANGVYDVKRDMTNKVSTHVRKHEVIDTHREKAVWSMANLHTMRKTGSHSLDIINCGSTKIISIVATKDEPAYIQDEGYFLVIHGQLEMFSIHGSDLHHTDHFLAVGSIYYNPPGMIHALAPRDGHSSVGLLSFCFWSNPIYNLPNTTKPTFAPTIDYVYTPEKDELRSDISDVADEFNWNDISETLQDLKEREARVNHEITLNDTTYAVAPRPSSAGRPPAPYPREHFLPYPPVLPPRDEPDETTEPEPDAHIFGPITDYDTMSNVVTTANQAPDPIASSATAGSILNNIARSMSERNDRISLLTDDLAKRRAAINGPEDEDDMDWE